MSAIFKRFLPLALSTALLLSITVFTTASDPIPLDQISDPAVTETIPAESVQPDTPVLTKHNQYAVIDYTNAHEGYVKVKYTANPKHDIVVYVHEDSQKYYLYQNDLTPGEWTTLPLGAGDGHYTINFWERSSTGKYYSRSYFDLDVTIADPADVISNNYAAIDTSHLQDGYIMVNFTDPNDGDCDAFLYQGTNLISYSDLTPGEWTTLPLSAADGTYSIDLWGETLCRFVFEFDASLSDSLSPYLLSTPMINYSAAPNAVALAKSLTANCATDREKADVIYNYVANHISYDYAGREYYPAGYITDMDAVLSSGKGICGHYSALMAGMLRSLGIPARMEYGYVDTYDLHAWVSVYFPDTGWIRYDPTFLSTTSRASTDWILNYISNDANYRTTRVF